MSSVGMAELTFAVKYRHTSGMLLLCCLFCLADLRVCVRYIEVNRDIKMSLKDRYEWIKKDYLWEPQVEIETGESSPDIRLVTNIVTFWATYKTGSGLDLLHHIHSRNSGL
jgi:hypothetical protein